MKKTRGRPKFGYFMIDCPSDHEIDDWLVSECDVIHAVLANRNLKSRLKKVRCSTKQSFESIPATKYSGIRYVHIGGHGSEHGLGFIGGAIAWSDVGKKLKQIFPALVGDERRILTLSCCHSDAGVAVLKSQLANHFSGIYSFSAKKIDYSTAIATWSMFFFRKDLDTPQDKIAADINSFFGGGKNVLRFSLVDKEHRKIR